MNLILQKESDMLLRTYLYLHALYTDFVQCTCKYAFIFMHHNTMDIRTRFSTLKPMSKTTLQPNTILV